ncbi:MAG: phosphate signaling complex protein PhoU [Actinomycetota bacterium]|nr:phosphate signaling complex protein PhoU [Actinomycetota bacterium]
MAVRASFHDELQAAEAALIEQGALVRRQLDRVVEALVRRDPGIGGDVIAGDDAVDALYLETESRVLSLLALQAPVAGDLRLVSAILHSNMHVERMGDLCVNIAKFVQDRHPYPPDAPMVSRLRDMGSRAGAMLETALTGFSQRNLELAEELTDKDDALDRLNRGMLGDLRRYAGDERAFEWATNLVLVARYLERFGDHCVDIGEQTAFLITGVFREFTDASRQE